MFQSCTYVLTSSRMIHTHIFRIYSTAVPYLRSCWERHEQLFASSRKPDPGRNRPTTTNHSFNATFNGRGIGAGQGGGGVSGWGRYSFFEPFNYYYYCRFEA